MAQSRLIEEVPLPDAPEDADRLTFEAVVNVYNAIGREFIGPASGDTTTDEFMVGMLDQSHERKRLFVVRDDDEVVAFGFVGWSVEPDTQVTWLDVNVLAEHRRRGIGTALFDALEDLARDSGRPYMQGGSNHDPNVPGPRLNSPTGFGSLPSTESGVRFLVHRGYGLEQVYRVSALHLPVEPEKLAEQLAAAQRRAGNDYRIHTWTVSTPEQWRSGVAYIMSRMATDAPTGGLVMEEEPWDAERIRQNDERRIRAGRTSVVATVEHIPTGKLVAFNGLSLAADLTEPVHQGLTLVLKDHRGHRLGTIVKIANIQQIARIRPQAPLIVTDNAEENRPMLDVNEAVGFVPIAYQGTWKKVVLPQEVLA